MHNVIDHIYPFHFSFLSLFCFDLILAYTFPSVTGETGNLETAKGAD
jgi:hypothetical protein